MRRPRLRSSVSLLMISVALAAGLLAVARRAWHPLDRRGPASTVRIAPHVIATMPDGGFLQRDHWIKKYVLLTFWSRTDAASLREFARWKEIRRDFARDDRFLIVSLCTDEDWDAWLRFLEAQGTVDYDEPRGRLVFYMDHKWWNAFQDSSNVVSADLFSVTHLPDAFLIAPGGRILAEHVPGDRLREVIAAALQRDPRSGTIRENLANRAQTPQK